jgi:hypothetical protein
MKPRLIVIDGKTYNSVDEMPADVRQKYEAAMSSLKDQNSNNVPDAFETNNIFADKNQNGIPDILENSAGGPIFAKAMKIMMDGKQFNSLDELPPEVRARYETAMGALDANRNGIPDFAEGMMGTVSQPTTAPVSTNIAVETPRPASSTPIPVSPTISQETSNGWLLALLGIVLLFVCAAGAAGIWYFFVR